MASEKRERQRANREEKRTKETKVDTRKQRMAIVKRYAGYALLFGAVIVVSIRFSSDVSCGLSVSPICADRSTLSPLVWNLIRSNHLEKDGSIWTPPSLSAWPMTFRGRGRE